MIPQTQELLQRNMQNEEVQHHTQPQQNMQRLEDTQQLQDDRPEESRQRQENMQNPVRKGERYCDFCKSKSHSQELCRYAIATQSTDVEYREKMQKEFEAIKEQRTVRTRMKRKRNRNVLTRDARSYRKTPQEVVVEPPVTSTPEAVEDAEEPEQSLVEDGVSEEVAEKEEVKDEADDNVSRESLESISEFQKGDDSD